MKTRILSLILALALLIGMVPAPAFAEADPEQGHTTEVPAAEAPGEVPDGEPAEAPAEAPADPAVEAVQAMIDALPEENDMSEEALDALEEAYAAFESLSKAQQARIVGYDRLEALFQWTNTQMSLLAGAQTLSGNVTWKDQTLTSGFQLDGDTTLTLEGTNTLQCDAPLDLQGHTLTVQGTGSLDIISTGTAVDDYYISSSTNGGTFALTGGTVTVTGGKRGLSVRNLSVTGGKLHVEASVGGIAAASLTVTGGSLYASGSSAAVYCYQGNKIRMIDDSLSVLYSPDAKGTVAGMEEGSAQDTCRGESVKTVYIGKTAPRVTLIVSETQQGTLYEGLEGQSAAFSVSWKNVDSSTLSTVWETSAPGLTPELSADRHTLTVSADSTAKQGSYNLTLSVTGSDGAIKRKTVAVVVSGPPITVTGQPEGIVLRGGSVPAGAGTVRVKASLGKDLTDSIRYQWKLENGTELAGYTEPTLSVLRLSQEGKLVKDAEKPWLLSARIYCTLTYGTYHLDTNIVTAALNECTHPLADLQGNCRQCGNPVSTDVVIVKDDGSYWTIDNDAPPTASSAGGFLLGGGTFYLTGDLLNRALDVSNTEAGSGTVTLDLQNHTLKHLQLGNFPYDCFTVKNGTLTELSADAAGTLVLEDVHFTQAVDFPSQLALIVQGENALFDQAVTFRGTTRLRGGSFSKGLSTQSAAKALSLLDGGFAFQDGSGHILDASEPGELIGTEIRVVSHNCNYINGKCTCGRCCDHIGTTDEDGYCTNCHALVFPFAIGENRYTSLDAALAAAEDGDTVTLRGDYFQENITVEIAKSVILDLGDHTLSGNPENPLLRILAKDVTIRHGGVTNTNTAKSSPAVTVGKLNASDAKLTVESVCFTGSATRQEPRDPGLSIVAGNHAQVISGIFNGGIYTEGSLTMTGGSATSLGLGYLFGDIRLSDCAFDRIQFSTAPDFASLLVPDYAYQTNNGWVKLEEMDGSSGAQILKCPHPDGLSDTAACPYCGKKCGHTNMSLDTGLCPDCGLQVYAAKIDTTPYATLTEALEQVQTGQTVTMLVNSTLPDDYTLTRETQLNLNGKTLTGTSLTVSAPFTLRGGIAGVPIYVNSQMTLETVTGRMTCLNEPVYINDSGNLSITTGNASASTVYVNTGGSLELRGGSIGHLYVLDGKATLFSGSIGYGISIASGNLLSVLAEGKALAMSDGTIIDGSLPGVRRRMMIVDHKSHTFLENGKCACGVQAAASVTAQDGSITYYENITQAIAAATQSPDWKGECNTTVTLLDHIGETIENNRTGFTLDLNGKTVAELKLTGSNFTLMDSKETGTIQKFTGELEACRYLKEGWGLADENGMAQDLLVRLRTNKPLRAIYSGVTGIERSTMGKVFYGQQKIPFSLRFKLEDQVKVSSVQVRWTYESKPQQQIGSIQTLTKGEDGFYTFDPSQTLDENPLNYSILRPENTYMLFSEIKLTLEDGQTRSIVLRKYSISSEKANLANAELELGNADFTFSPDPQTGAGRNQTLEVRSVSLYGTILTEGTDYEVSGNTASNAGRYTLTVKAKDGSEYFTGSKTVEWEIQPLHAQIDIPALLTKTYDGTKTAPVPSLTMKVGSDTVVFHENTDYTVLETQIDDTNAGKWRTHVTVRWIGDSANNYVFSGSEFETWCQITPADPDRPLSVTFTVANGTTPSFTMENLDSFLADLTAPCTYGSISYGAPTVLTKAKGYSISVQLDNGSLKLNVTGTGDTEGPVAEVTIPVTTQNYGNIQLIAYVDAKNRILPTVKPVKTSNLLYGQQLAESTVTSSQVYDPDGMTPIPGAFRWQYPETVLQAGEYLMEMVFVPEDADTYAEVPFSAHVTVNPRPVTLSGITVADKLYDGTANAIVSDKGAFDYVVPGDTVTYTVSAAFADKNAARDETGTVIPKSVALTVALTGDTARNYTLTENSQNSAAAMILPKIVSVTGGLTAQERGYAPGNISVQILRKTVIFDGKLDGDDLDVSVGSGSMETADAGENKPVAYSLILTGKDRGNYNFTGGPALTVNIRRIPQSLSFTEKSVTKTYGDAPFDNILMRADGDGRIRYSSENPTVATVDTRGKVTIHGVGTTRIIAKAEETTNYIATETAFELTVTKRAATLENKDYPLTYTYSGSPIPAPDAANFTTNNPDGTFRFCWIRDGAPLTVGFVPSDAGTYQLRVTVDGSDNYEAVSRDFTVIVNPLDISRNMQITLGENLTYNGKEQTQVIVSVDVPGVNGDVTYTVTGDTATDAGEYQMTFTGTGNFTGTKAVPWSVARKDVTIEGAAAEPSKVYDGTTGAAIQSSGTLSENFDGEDLQILPGTASYADKNVGTGKPVIFAGFSLTGSRASNYRLTGQPASVTADITIKDITLTVTVQDKPFDGNTQAELDRLIHTDFAEADDIRLVTGTPSFAHANAKENIPILFTAFALEGQDAANYRLTNPFPENVTASIIPTSDYLDLSNRPEEDEVWVNGEKYPVRTDGGRYIRLPGEGDLLTTYTMDASGGYPTGMKVYRISRQKTGAALTEIPEFTDLLLYVGCSIRLNGTKGIRMITGIDQSVKKSLTSAAGLAGYTLEEYGTVVMRGAGTPTLENTRSHNHAYKKGQADPVFGRADGRIQYTNVLVGFSLEDCKDDLTLRPYITLRDTTSGKLVTLYGGCVTRSIGYIAKQNESLYAPGSAGYKYIREIIDAVYGQDKQEP